MQYDIEKLPGYTEAVHIGLLLEIKKAKLHVIQTLQKEILEIDRRISEIRESDDGGYRQDLVSEN